MARGSALATCAVGDWCRFEERREGSLEGADDVIAKERQDATGSGGEVEGFTEGADVCGRDDANRDVARIVEELDFVGVAVEVEDCPSVKAEVVDKDFRYVASRELGVLNGPKDRFERRE